MSRNHWAISRRTMLRGAGVAIALPLLEAMLPTSLVAGEPKIVQRKTPTRFAVLYVPNGVGPADWSPKVPGPLQDLPPILAPLEKMKKNLLVIDGLTHKKSYPKEGHYSKGAGFLTGTVVKQTTGADINCGGISMDQLMAKHLGQYTRLPSIELSAQRANIFVDKNVNLTSLYGCHISWDSPTTPVAREAEPKAAFDRLFRGQEGADGGAVAKPKALNPWDDRSILDFILSDGTAIKGKLGIADQRKLDEYLTSVRDVERRIQSEIKAASEPKRVDPASLRELGALAERVRGSGSGNKMEYANRVRLMMDIILLGFWTDSTRIATFMFGNEVSGQNFSFLDGVSGSHHEISHHENKPDKIKQYQRISTWHVEQYAYLLERMAAIKEGPNTLLDNSMMLFGSAIRDGNKHNVEDLPLLLAGTGGKTITPGRYLQKGGMPFCNLHTDIMLRMGLQVDDFSDATGTIKDLQV